MPAKRVVITGLGTTSPLGGDVASTWEAMVKGQSGVRHLTDDWAEEMPVKIAARVAVEPTEVLERVRARRLDRSAQFAVIAAEEAWKDSGPSGWEAEVERFHAALAAFDAFLASDAPLAAPPQRIFQGAIADALTHVGQIALLRRLAGSPVRGENYSRAEIVAGRVGAEQAPARREFD